MTDWYWCPDCEDYVPQSDPQASKPICGRCMVPMRKRNPYAEG